MTGRVHFFKPRSLLRAAAAGLICLFFLAAAPILLFRYLFLPHINDYRESLCSYLSSKAGVQISADRLVPSGSSILPRFTIEGLEVRQPGSADGIRVQKAEAVLDPSSLLRLQPVFSSLSITGPQLDVRKTGDGLYSAGGFTFDLSGGSEDSRFLGWLMSQSGVSVRQASITYRDETAADAPLMRLEGAGFALRQTLSGWQAGLQGSLLAPGREPSLIDLRLQIGRSLGMRKSNWKTWRGRFYANAGDISLTGLSAARQTDPHILAGQAAAKAWGEFDGGVLSSLISEARVSGLRVGLARGAAPLDVPSLSGRVLLSRGRDGGLLVSSPGISLPIGPGGRSAAVSFTLENHPKDKDRNTLVLSVSSADLETLSRAAQAAAGPGRLTETLSRMVPRGSLKQVSLRLGGSWDAPKWEASADFHDVSFAAQPEQRHDAPGIPGASRLSGHLWMNAEQGAVQLDSAGGAAAFPGIFEYREVPFRHLTGSVFWNARGPLRLAFRNLKLINDDLAISADADWRDADGGGIIRVSGEAARARMPSLYRYMPIVAGRTIQTWLEQALRGGLADRAFVEWNGPLSAFPYTGRDAGRGQFLVTGSYSGAKLDFLPTGQKISAGQWSEGGQWPVIEQASGQFLFHGDRMVITAQNAASFGVRIPEAVAEIPSMGLYTPHSDLYVRGSARGAAQDMIGYTAASPVSGWLGHFLDSARATGNASLELSLQIPLDEPEHSRVAGELDFSGNDIAFGGGIPELGQASGRLHFTQDHYWGEKLTANVWGMRASGRLTRTAGGDTEILASARVSPETARPLLESRPEALAILQRIQGSAEASARILVSDHSTQVRVTSSLQGISVRLPRPFGKHSEEEVPSVFNWISRDGAPLEISARYGDKANGIARLAAGPSGLRLVQAALAAGEQAQLPARGLSLRATLPDIPIEPWQETLEPVIDAAGRSSTAALSESLGPVSARIRTRQLIFKARSFPDVTLSVRHGQPGQKNSAWEAELRSPQASGKGLYQPGTGRTPAYLSLDLTRLYVPEESRRRFHKIFSDTPADRLPSMDVRIGDFKVGSASLGSISLKARASDPSLKSHRWRLESFAARLPEATFSASGQWERGGASGRSATSLKGSLVVKDSRRLLKSLDLPGDVVRDAPGKIELEANWKGAPQDFALKNLNGRLSADIGGGRFMQVEPGVVGRFMSLLSMQSLMKRLTLDFKDVFGRGFSFNSIKLNGTTTNGVFVTDDLVVDGSAASIAVSGSADLARQNLDAKLLVLPELHTEAPAIALALANPLVGVGSFIAQFALKKPISYILATEYTVKGPWDHLSFEKTPAAPSAQNSSPDN